MWNQECLDHCARDARLHAEINPEDAAVHAGGSADTAVIDVCQSWCLVDVLKHGFLNSGATCVYLSILIEKEASSAWRN